MAPTINNAVRRIRTRGENPATQSRQPGWSQSWLSGRSGRAFDASQARSIPAVGRCLNIIAGTIASFPIHIFEETTDGAPRHVKGDQSRILWGVPNPELMSAFVFWRLVVIHKVLRENVFIFVVKDNAGRPLELWPINPTRFRVGRLDDGRKIYEVDGKEAFIDYKDGGEIVHVVGDSEDGLVGIGPLQRYASAFELGLTTEEYASDTYDDGTPPGILHTDQTLSKDEAEELLDSWMAKRAVRPRRPAVLTNGLTWETTQFNAEESQMIESRHFNIREIARIFGVPPHLLGDTEAVSNWGTGTEEIFLQFRTVTLNDHMIPIEQVMSTAFLPEGQWALFNPDSVLRPDTLKRYQAHEIALRARFKTPNEVRRLEGDPSIEGGDELALPPNASPDAAAEAEQVAARAEANLRFVDGLVAGVQSAVGDRLTAVEAVLKAPRPVVEKQVRRDGEGRIVGITERESEDSA